MHWKNSVVFCCSCLEVTISRYRLPNTVHESTDKYIVIICYHIHRCHAVHLNQRIVTNFTEMINGVL